VRALEICRFFVWERNFEKTESETIIKNQCFRNRLLSFYRQWVPYVTRLPFWEPQSTHGWLKSQTRRLNYCGAQIYKISNMIIKFVQRLQKICNNSHK